MSEYSNRLPPVNDAMTMRADMTCLLTNDLPLLRLWHGEALP